MSRIGNSPISIPSTVSIKVEGHSVETSGPLGSLSLKIRPEVKVEVENGRIKISRKKEDRLSRSLHGLTRSLINNMVLGVEKGWQKKLELVGVGFRVSGGEEKVILSVGYSHPVEVSAPGGIKFAIEDNNKIIVSGIDRVLVGQIAAKIRQVRPPEPYKGKGIRYSGEYVRRKPGKAGKVGAK